MPRRQATGEGQQLPDSNQPPLSGTPPGGGTARSSTGNVLNSELQNCSSCRMMQYARRECRQSTVKLAIRKVQLCDPTPGLFNRDSPQLMWRLRSSQKTHYQSVFIPSTRVRDFREEEEQRDGSSFYRSRKMGSRKGCSNSCRGERDVRAVMRPPVAGSGAVVLMMSMILKPSLPSRREPPTPAALTTTFF